MMHYRPLDADSTKQTTSSDMLHTVLRGLEHMYTSGDGVLASDDDSPLIGFAGLSADQAAAQYTVLHRNIDSGTFIVEYLGEVISEARRSKGNTIYSEGYGASQYAVALNG